MPRESGLPNLITIIGRDVPSNYEITVDGAIELIDGNPTEEGIIVSEQTVEGTIDTDVQRFCFSGQMANVRLVDWNGVSAPESPSTPDVHVDYGAVDRNDNN